MGIRGVADFDQFETDRKQKKLLGQTVENTIVGEGEMEGEGQEDNPNDMSRYSSVCEGTIAPTLEVER